MKYAKWIRTDGTTHNVEPGKDGKFTLEKLKQAVDGYIEIVPYNSRYVLIVNEDGISRRLPVNEFATAIYGELLSRAPILGDVLFVSRDLIE